MFLVCANRTSKGCFRERDHCSQCVFLFEFSTRLPAFVLVTQYPTVSVTY